MAVRALAAENLSGVTVVPLADVHRHAVWVAHLRSILPPFETVYTNNPLTRLLFRDAGYSVISPRLVDRERYEGSGVRAALAEGRSWEPLVPPSVAEYLEEIHAADRLKLLASKGPDVAPEHPV